MNDAAPRGASLQALAAGGGELGARIAARDWSGSPIGPAEAWPPALRAVLGFMLRSPVPIVLLWGEDGVMLYNDAYSVFAGGRHPQLLGSKVREGWPEVAAFNDHVMRVGLAGGTLHYRDQELTLYRHGRPEPVWMNLDYSPVPDEEGRPLGVLCILAETTERVAAERRREAAEEALRRSADRLRVLDRLSAETAPLAEADAVLRATTRLVGEHMGVALCAYADMDEDQDGFTIRGDWWAPGSRSIVGRYRLADFGTRAVESLGAGLPLVIRDAARELPAAEAATFAAIGVAATLCMPLVKDGRLTALMAIHDRTPRDWTDEELAFLREVTLRSWAHVERVGAIAELRESEGQFRAFAQAVPNHVWAARPDGSLYWFNDQVYAYCGEPPGSLDGTAWVRIVHPEDAPAAAAAWARALGSGEVYEAEFRIRRADGRFRWFLTRAEPVRGAGGAIVDWVGTNTDIHDRRGAEGALRVMNETLEARVSERTAERNRLWTLSQDMLARADYDGMMSAVSPAWTRVLGWSDEELLTRPYASLLHPEDAGETLAALARMGETGRPTRFENRIATSGGGWRPIEWTVAPEPDGANFIAVGRDVSAERARQAELEAAQEALRQSQKMEAMGQLTGGVAHDFNNLLTPIIGALDRLLARGLGSERERRLMAGAIESAERAKTLVQRLLAFARRQPLQPVAVDIGALVESMADLLGATLGPTIEVRTAVAPGLPPAKADPNQLEMALLNLAVNARDAMPGGGRLAIAASSERVRPAAAGEAASGSEVEPGADLGLEPGPYVRLSVADTGTGMDADTRRRAVEPFFSTKGIGRGTGLGLSMVHGLAAQLGGGLAIRSEPGEGTTIDLWLPVSTEVPDAPEAGRAPLRRAAGRGRALLVDDEALVRMSTAAMLDDLGFDVREAGSAEDALRLLREGAAVDLLVTDHLMPGLSGAELAREARRLRPGLPALIVSGYAEVEGLAPDLPRLVKPFRAAELAAWVAALMPGEAGPA